MYLLVIALYMAGDTIVAQFHVAGDLAQTAANVRAGEIAYRAGLSLQLLSSVTTILLGGAFYALLRPVDANLALFALCWRVAEAAMGGLGSTIRFTGLENFVSANGTWDEATRRSIRELLGAGHDASFFISVIFFSFGSITFFYLLLRSRFIPRALAVLGLLASVSVTSLGFANLVTPELPAAADYGWALIFAAEIATGLWLLIRGANFAHWTSGDPPAR